MRDRKFRVLLVEDDVPLRELTAVVLKESGRFEIVGVAGDGREAIQRSQTLQPDVVLLDLAMPRVDGFAALPEIRRVAPQSRVIALSMLQRDRHEKEVLAKGAVAFLDKDLDSDELVRRILAILDRHDTQPPGRTGPPRFLTFSRLPFLDTLLGRRGEPWFIV